MFSSQPQFPFDLALCASSWRATSHASAQGIAGEPGAACHHPAGTFGRGRQPAPLVKTQPPSRGQLFAGCPASTRTLPLFTPAPMSLLFIEVVVCASHPPTATTSPCPLLVQHSWAPSPAPACAPANVTRETQPAGLWAWGTAAAVPPLGHFCTSQQGPLSSVAPSLPGARTCS